MTGNNGYVSNGNGPSVYAVRLSVLARRQIDEERGRLTLTAGLTTARAWQDGLLAAITSLATYPEGCSLAPENRLLSSMVLRHLIYRRTRSGPAWRIIFSVEEANKNDPATVRIQHVRHGAQASLTEWPSDDENMEN
ncbi:MAG: type II toxin-antitoxin system RelE/ParE family toxin [Armatimonadota bacterium]|nr:type II toxin-antitoxin system RelE/ParE family toxin [Armatimonadota bacterium]